MTNDYWIGWILATLLIGAELLAPSLRLRWTRARSGTFYLLAVGIAFACGGLIATALSVVKATPANASA